MSEIPAPPEAEKFAAQGSSASSQEGNRNFFRDESGRILDEKENKAHVEATVNQNPDAFSPHNEQIASVLDHTETPVAKPLEVPLTTNGVKPEEAEMSYSDTRDIFRQLKENALSKATNDLKAAEAGAVEANVIRDRLRRQISEEHSEFTPATLTSMREETKQILSELDDLQEKKEQGAFAATARRLLLRLSPLILGISALLAQENQVNSSPAAAVEPQVEPPVASEPRSAGIDEKPLMVRPYTVEAGDSISGILAKFEPKKWLDESGNFKMDEATQDNLYSEVREIFDLNRKSMAERNPKLFQQMDEEETALGRKLNGAELKTLVEKTGGDRELVLIVPGEKITLPVKQ